MKKSIILITFCLLGLFCNAQLDEECKLAHGMNLGGVYDYATELPFVNLMRNARQWYTKDIGNPNAPFNSEQTQNLSYRPDGYPTHIPQSVTTSEYDQKVSTIWAIMDSWPSGEYTILWEGTGVFSFFGAFSDMDQVSDNRIVFNHVNAPDNVLELTIEESDINDPIRNVRVIMPGHIETYADQPFNPAWIDRLTPFKSVRFMDWGSTNNWGIENGEGRLDASLFNWSDRAQMDHYTWATAQGVPYEMMIKLLNDYDLDGWICVPHRAGDEYITNMAQLFYDELETDRHLTVEYSNEIWNWIFDQTHWLNKYGCEDQGVPWPEGIVPYVQNCLDRWSDVFVDDLDRITRVAGVQVSWQDVSNRMVRNLRTGSFDAITPTFYFGLTEDGDMALDAMGEDATVRDIAHYAREGMEETKIWLQTQKDELADPLGVPIVFYEGGQHITGHPFGITPTYEDAILEIQRDTAMYNMYTEWFDFLKTLQEGEEALQLMNFSFIANRSAQYGSWGILETMDQDTSEVSAPKYSAILDDINNCQLVNNELPIEHNAISIHPNPSDGLYYISGLEEGDVVQLVSSTGNITNLEHAITQISSGLNLSRYPSGMYTIIIYNRSGQLINNLKIIKL